ncbi:MAG: hypothetical protein ACFE85_14625 [Candidatus Hodarchaeota archaeon]
MKKYRPISIRNSIFREFRNNLRAIISLAHWDQIAALNALRNAIIFTDKNLSIDEEQKQLELDREILDLQRSLDNSICKCPTCGSIKNDMIFFPILNSWHCVECDLKNLIWFPNYLNII